MVHINNIEGKILLKSLKSKKGLSTVIAQILMISATISIGVIAISWAIPTLTLYQSSAGAYYQMRSDALKESFIIEDVWFSNTTTTPPSINITLRNVGSIEINVSAIYISGTNISGTMMNTTCYDRKGNLKPLPMIAVGNRTGQSALYSPDPIIIRRNPSWKFKQGQSYQIIVATKRGNQVSLTVGP